MPVTLDQKVANILAADDRDDGPMGVVHRRPALGPDRYLSDWEHSLRTWGLVYGVTFGIARCDDLWKPTASVAQRAFDVAWPRFIEYAGPLERPNVDAAVREVLRLYDAEPSRSGTENPALSDDLAKAIERLPRVFGT